MNPFDTAQSVLDKFPIDPVDGPDVARAERLHRKLMECSREDELDARLEMDGDRYDDLRDDDRQRAADINAERRLMGFE